MAGNDNSANDDSLFAPLSEDDLKNIRGMMLVEVQEMLDKMKEGISGDELYETSAMMALRCAIIAGSLHNEHPAIVLGVWAGLALESDAETRSEAASIALAIQAMLN